MKLPVSNKQSSIGKRPRIKKGYYPAKLLKIEEYKDKNGNIKDCTYGHQLIFSFGIYNPSEKGTPLTEITHCPEENSDKKEPVILPKFVYHEYKDKNTGDYRTAVTANSAITKLLVALGWTFDARQDVDIESFVGKMVEVNINDYDVVKEGQTTYQASSINGVEKYNVPTEPTKKNETKEILSSDKTLEEKKVAAKELRDAKIITEEGYNQAIEQLEAQENERKK